MANLISRFDKNKLLHPDDYITSGIACRLLLTHAKTLNEWVDTGLVPAVRGQQRTRWDRDSGSWRVFKVSHLLAHAVLRKYPIDESMLVKINNPLQTINQKFNRVFCYGYYSTQNFPDNFSPITMRGIYRTLELCPIVPIVIGPEINLGKAIGIAEELILDFDPLDINIWRQVAPYQNERDNINDFDLAVFKETFDDLASVYDYFLTKREPDNANAEIMESRIPQHGV